MKKKNIYYDALDGLRGVAALAVLVFHYLELMYSYTDNILGHGFLAVDFFFCLSGFVIAHAYDHRMKNIGAKGFLTRRLIRLHPLVVFGSLLGFITYIANPFLTQALPELKLMLFALFGSIFLIPTPFLPFRWGGLFPYNTAFWSLFFEYIISILYALVLCRLKKGWLLVLGAISFVWIFYTAKTAGMIIGGWSDATFFEGFPRVAYSFTAGIIIYRFKLGLKSKFGLVLPFLLLLLVFFMPHQENDWWLELLLVTIILPLIVSIGSEVNVKGWLKNTCNSLGRLSYPLYTTHIVTVWLFSDYCYSGMFSPSRLNMHLVSLLLIIINLVFAYVVMRFYDEPVRAWLTKKIVKH